MSLQEKIQLELKTAMLAKDVDRLSTIRLLKSALGYVQIERKSDQLSDAEVVVVIQKEIKKRRDSQEQFRNAGRAELSEKEAKEAAVLETFLPAPFTPAELDQLVRSTIQELAATSKKDMGPVIKAVQAKAAGRADGKSISTLVGSLLPLCLFLLSVLGLAGCGTTAGPMRTAQSYFTYIGTYTDAKSQGIYVSRFDPAAGTWTAPSLAAKSTNPSFVAAHPNGRFIYAVNEVSEFQGQRAGAVSAFALDPASGLLTFLNQQSSGGPGPCHLVVDRAGHHVLVANYGGGSIASLPIKEDGRLGEAVSVIQHQGSSVDRGRQEGPHAHCIVPDAANRFVCVADLGLDRVMIYRYDEATGKLSPNSPAFASVTPGSGPRHLVFHPNNRFAYEINEMACTVKGFQYDPTAGVLRELQTISTLPPGQAVLKGYSTAEIQVHPNGKFLYGSNRGHDTIAIYAIDERGHLTWLANEPTGGKVPRHFTLDPTGKWLFAENQESDSIVLFRVNERTGLLTPTGRSLEVGAPACIDFVPVRSN